MARHKITDQQWDAVKHLVREPASTGRPPADPLTLLEGIMEPNGTLGGTGQ